MRYRVSRSGTRIAILIGDVGPDGELRDFGMRPVITRSITCAAYPQFFGETAFADLPGPAGANGERPFMERRRKSRVWIVEKVRLPFMIEGRAREETVLTGQIIETHQADDLILTGPAVSKVTTSGVSGTCRNRSGRIIAQQSAGDAGCAGGRDELCGGQAELLRIAAAAEPLQFERAR